MLWHFLLLISQFFFAENMIKLIVENVKARSLGKLTECIVNGPNISQMVLRGFKLTINATTEAIFKQTIFLNVQIICTLKNWCKISFLQLIVSLITSKCVTKYLEERILILSSLAQKLQLKKFDYFWPPGAKSFLGSVSSFISFIVRR